jgi:hypothetical protein
MRRNKRIWGRVCLRGEEGVDEDDMERDRKVKREWEGEERR